MKSDSSKKHTQLMLKSNNGKDKNINYELLVKSIEGKKVSSVYEY